MMHSNSKGFAAMKAVIIGAVVILIIVAVIVFVSVRSGVQQEEQQSLNYTIKGNLAVTLTNGVLYLDQNGSFQGFCEDEYFKGPATVIESEGQAAVCKMKSDNKSWCGCATLKVTPEEPAGSTFCVDSRGYKRITQNAGGCDARCGNEGICID